MYLLIAIRPDGTLITRKNSDHAHLLDIGKYWIEEKKVKSAVVIDHDLKICWWKVHPRGKS